MRLAILYAMVLVIILLSGCTYFPFWEEKKEKQNLLPIINAHSDLQEVKSNEGVWVYIDIENPNPTTPGMEEEYTYKIDCNLKSPGLFKVEEEEKGENILKPKEKTTYSYFLIAPEVSVKTPSKVIFEISFEKTSHFYFSTVFVNEDYKKQLEIAGKKIPRGQRYFSLSDNLVNLDIELNKDYYTASKDKVYGNIKYNSPFEDIEIKNIAIYYFDKYGNRNKIEVKDSCDNITKTCSFALPTIETTTSFEKKYEIEINYVVKKTVSLDFWISEEKAYAPAVPTLPTYFEFEPEKRIFVLAEMPKTSEEMFKGKYNPKILVKRTSAIYLLGIAEVSIKDDGKYSLFSCYESKEYIKCNRQAYGFDIKYVDRNTLENKVGWNCKEFIRNTVEYIEGKISPAPYPCSWDDCSAYAYIFDVQDICKDNLEYPYSLSKEEVDSYITEWHLSEGCEKWDGSTCNNYKSTLKLYTDGKNSIWCLEIDGISFQVDYTYFENMISQYSPDKIENKEEKACNGETKKWTINYYNIYFERINVNKFGDSDRYYLKFEKNIGGTTWIIPYNSIEINEYYRKNIKGEISYVIWPKNGIDLSADKLWILTFAFNNAINWLNNLTVIEIPKDILISE